MRRIEAWWTLESTALTLCCGLVAARGDEEGEGEGDWCCLLLPFRRVWLLC